MTQPHKKGETISFLFVEEGDDALVLPERLTGIITHKEWPLGTKVILYWVSVPGIEGDLLITSDEIIEDEEEHHEQEAE